MLKKFQVKNFKNFKENISVDFTDIGGYQFSKDCITNNVIGKMLIYGRNATGKTNLGTAIMDVTLNLVDFRFHRLSDGVFLNADSTQNYAEFVYTFQFDKDEIIYKYSKFSSIELRDEELVVNRKRVFYCDFWNKKYDFENLSYVGAETVITGRYLQSMEQNEAAEEVMEPTLPFLRWIISNTAFPADALLLKLDDYIKRMTMSNIGGFMIIRARGAYDNFFKSLKDKRALKEFEDYLNIMGVECKLVLKKLPDGQEELYFKHDKLVPFYENASSGTIVLTNLYRRLLVGKTASFMYIDEFDAFYHYEMAENVVKYFKLKYPNCQIVLTSHNTNLMTNQLMRPDCVFILSRSGKLTPLCNATERELREGHNLEKMYISGEFEEYE